ncbi:MAG: HEAT repeat domain-containing protein, partial [Chloroflexota bacterium]|nr:HEAT repeat domain-containing protein [Chloroflexota bacterium]
AILSRVPRQILYIAVPLLISILLIVARFALLTGANWLYPALWLGKEALNILVSLVLWGIAGVVCDTRQAKRLFPLFNAARILGQVVGGFITGLLVASLGTENLLLVWAGTLMIAFLLSRALLAQHQIISAPARKSRRKQPTLAQEMQRGFQYVRGSKLMTWISISTIFFSMLYFSISLPFSRVATEQFPNEDLLASFLGLFNGISTAAAFLASLLLANKLFARVGIMACILALPIIYFIGFGGLALAPVFAIIVAFRFVQMLWLSGIADPAWQSMFNVIPPEKRDQVRTFMSGVPEQAGTFIAGGILIVGEQTLTPQQLYFIGLVAAACCTYIIYQARRGYDSALIDALRAGRPNLFYGEEQPFGGFHQDGAAIQTALRGFHASDPMIRRVSAEILGHLALPESTHALVHGISDSDSLVRAASLRALSRSNATPALLDIAASLSDPEPDVRFEAVSALSVLSASSLALSRYLTPLLDDEDTRVSARAAVSILKSHSSAFAMKSWDGMSGETDISRVEGPVIARAKHHLRNTAVLGDLDARLRAITALGEWGDKEAFDFLTNELLDRGLQPGIKNAILTSLVQINSQESIPYLLESLRNPTARETSARLLGELGAPVMGSVVDALQDETSVDGALLTLQYLPMPPAKPLLDLARASVSRAGEYDALMRGVPLVAENEALSLLVESLHDKSHRFGIRALRAIGLLGDREAMNTAIENLQTRDASERANVIEALESNSAKYRDVLQPLMKLWEDESVRATSVDWERLLTDEDAWIRECAAFAKNYGEMKMDTFATLSLMDRILFLKRVSLFENLSPADLKQVASIAEEELFADGDIIAQQGEPGDALFVIISGEVSVMIMKDGQNMEAVRRRSGEYVGEMSIINREPRMATLIASGDVRALCIDQKSFEGLIRERPEVSLSVIKVLSKRLKEATEQK